MLHKWITPVATLALLAGLAITARAADPVAPVAGKATLTIKVVDADGKAVDGATVDLTVPAKRKPKAAAPTPAPAEMPKVAEDPKPADPVAPTAPPADAGGRRQTRPKPLQSTTTDADGTASFKDVADGTYAVVARLKSAGNGRERVTVTGGKDASVTVTLKRKADK